MKYTLQFSNGNTPMVVPADEQYVFVEDDLVCNGFPLWPRLENDKSLLTAGEFLALVYFAHPDDEMDQIANFKYKGCHIFLTDDRPFDPNTGEGATKRDVTVQLPSGHVICARRNYGRKGTPFKDEWVTQPTDKTLEQFIKLFDREFL